MRVVAGTIPILNKDKFLMIRSRNNKFIFPKGGVKKHESEKEAALRETKEEAGLLGDVMDKPFGIKRGIIFYILKVSSIPKVTDPSDLRDLLEVPFDFFRNKLEGNSTQVKISEKQYEIAEYAYELGNEVLERMDELENFLNN